MRSDAKASTAGSTQRQAKGLGRIFRGALVTRGVSPASKGSGAPKARRLTIAGLSTAAALLAMALSASAASAAAPMIAATWSESVIRTEATLKAEIDPEGKASTYHFEYGASPAYGKQTPEIAVGSDSVIHEVTRFLGGLTPGTLYHYRAVATSADGAVQGSDRTFTTYAIPAPNIACSNQVFRIGLAANLPDCRAYEMVSPVDKNGGDIATLALEFFANIRPSYNQSALDGDKLTYSSSTSFADQVSNRSTNQYIAARGADGWTTEGINARLGETTYTPFESFGFVTLSNSFKLFTPDLGTAWVVDQNKIPLTPVAGAGFVNLYERNNLGGDYTAITTTTPESSAGLEYYNTEVQGHSADFSHLVFAAWGKLTPDAASVADGTNIPQLYDYTGGALHFVSVLPNGTAAAEGGNVGSVMNDYENVASSSHAVSDDASRIYWSLGVGGHGTIYVRLNPDQPQSAIVGGECTEAEKACTVQVSSTGSWFWAASADGAKAIYSDGTGFFDASLNTSAATLHEFDLATKSSSLVAGQTSGVLGASDDLSRFYFASKEALDAGAVAGQSNLYLDHEGTISFIGPLADSDTGTPEIAGFGEYRATVNSVSSRSHAARVSPDGRYLVFESVSPALAALTGYDNTDAVNGKASMEVYRYDAEANGGAGKLSCVSCAPSGARLVGQELPEAYGVVQFERPSKVWAAAWIQTWIHPGHQSRVLSDDGSRIFFNSFDALTPEDTNGAQDVYQWQAAGTGECGKASPSFSALNDGCVSLISTGTNAAKSEFVDASADGSDVFFETSSEIDPRDPGLIDIYDARANGGFPLPSAPPDCEGEACQSASPPPIDPTPASASFKGAGTPAPRRARRACRARKGQGTKGKRQAKRKAQKHCGRANRRTAR